tara:strand:- start:964 stop:1293 length:330 start_codon:yes stop_codon:yes gene_type:complete
MADTKTDKQISDLSKDLMGKNREVIDKIKEVAELLKKNETSIRTYPGDGNDIIINILKKILEKEKDDVPKEEMIVKCIDIMYWNYINKEDNIGDWIIDAPSTSTESASA